MKHLVIPGIVTLGLLFAGPAGASDSTSPHWRSAFDLVLADSEAIREALARNTLGGVAEHAGSLLAELRHLEANITARHAGVRRGTAVELHEALPSMMEAAVQLQAAAGLEEARQAFRQLSRGLVLWHGLLEKPGKAIVVTCPGEGEIWLQKKRSRKKILNPYRPGSGDDCAPIPRSS